MAEYIIHGGRKLQGEFTVHGAKNAVLPIMAASILTGDESVISGYPDISDVDSMKEILTDLGCGVRCAGGMMIVDSRGMTCCEIPDDLMKRMRSSVFLIGALLARCGMAVISQPGGCSIGKRPIDLHIKALKQMGVRVEERDGQIVFAAEKLHGTDIYLEYPSVGATENIMLAAMGASGDTVIHNSAREPEIVDLQNYLNSCGADIKGAGSSRITVRGKLPLHGTCYRVMGDRIESGTFLMAAAGTGGELLVKGADPRYIKCCIRLLRFAGCTVKKEDGGIWIKGPQKLYGTGKIRTAPYPGFPTDLQPQFTALMTRAEGVTAIEETVFENRFGFTGELVKMGADIEISGRFAIIKGNDFLYGKRVSAPDLRGGAALVLAGLMGSGRTVVENIEHIERGYSGLHRELRLLGADIDRCI